MIQPTGYDAGFNREVDMYAPLLALFANLDIILAEVPFSRKHIDLLFASRTLQSLCAIETKLYNWRGAFKQAAINQVVAQRSYIALPASLAARVCSDQGTLFLSHNVGLISVNNAASVLIPASRNDCFSISHYRLIKETIRNVVLHKPKRIGVVADAIAKRKKTLVLLQTRTY